MVDRNGNQRVEKVEKDGKHVVFKQKVKLCGEAELPSGGYQWPVSILLPTKLPGSFKFKDEDSLWGGQAKMKAEIIYKARHHACMFAGVTMFLVVKYAQNL